MIRSILVMLYAAIVAAVFYASLGTATAQSAVPLVTTSATPPALATSTTLPAVTLGVGNTHVVAFATPPAIVGFAPVAASFVSGIGAPIIGGGGIHAEFGSSLVFGITSATARTATFTGDIPVYGSPVTVYGADVTGSLHMLGTDRILIDSGFQVSPIGHDTDLVSALDEGNNQSYRALLGYNFGSWTVKGGYQATDPNFVSPLDLDSLGSWQNPNNVAGTVIAASYQPTKSITLAANGNFLQGQSDLGALSPVGRDDSISHVNFQAHYGLTNSSSLDLGYEWVQWDLKNDQGLLAAAGKPVEQYITIGIGHNFGPSTALKMLYRIGNYTDDGTNMSPSGQDASEAIGQLSVKF